MISGVVFLQIFANTTMIIIQETSQGSQGWLVWKDISRLTDFLSIVMVVIPLISAMKKFDASSDTSAFKEKLKIILLHFSVGVLFYFFFYVHS